MPQADFVHDRFKLIEVCEQAKAVLKVLGNSQACSIPGCELAKQDAASLAMLFRHQREMADEKVHLFIARRFALRQSAVHVGQFAKNPWIEHRAAPDCHCRTARHTTHVKCVVNRPHVAVSDDRDPIDCGDGGRDAVEIDSALEALLSGPSVNRDRLDAGVLESSGQIGRRYRIAVPTEPHLDRHGQRDRRDDLFHKSAGMIGVTQKSRAPPLSIDLRHGTTHVDVDTRVIVTFQPTSRGNELIDASAEDLNAERSIVWMCRDKFERMTMLTTQLCRMNEVGRGETKAPQFSNRSAKSEMRVSRQRGEGKYRDGIDR